MKPQKQKNLVDVHMFLVVLKIVLEVKLLLVTVDIYSLGATLICFIASLCPFKHDGLVNWCKLFTNKKTPYLNQEYRDTLLQMVNNNPQKRPNISEIRKVLKFEPIECSPLPWKIYPVSTKTQLINAYQNTIPGLWKERKEIFLWDLILYVKMIGLIKLYIMLVNYLMIVY